jgi:hypothetical protein
MAVHSTLSNHSKHLYMLMCPPNIIVFAVYFCPVHLQIIHNGGGQQGTWFMITQYTNFIYLLSPNNSSFKTITERNTNLLSDFSLRTVDFIRDMIYPIHLIME